MASLNNETARDPYADSPRLPLEGEIDLRHLFGGEEPVELEIGAARGWFVVERLAADAQVRIVGLEIRRKWAFLADERLHDRGLAARARVFAEDAGDIAPRLAAASVRVVHVHFPDPWWKKRHQKRLVLNERMITELGRVLVPNGELFVQTDVSERADEYDALLARAPDFEPMFGSSRVAENPYGARSPRERKAIADGLPVHRLRFRRTSR